MLAFFFNLFVNRIVLYLAWNVKNRARVLNFEWEVLSSLSESED